MPQVFDDTFHRALQQLDIETLSLSLATTKQRPPAKVNIDEVAGALRNLTTLLKGIVDHLESD
jgi:hypothetical protein